MKRNRIHLLVVDDDPTQGKALEAAFKRSGYQVTLCNSSVKAIAACQHQEFKGLFIDCMLPRMNGVDLAQEIIEQSAPHRPKVFLYSGIFKDKSFIKDATDRTHCEHFFLKPLDLEEVLLKVDNAFTDLVDSEESPTVRLYGSENLSDGDLVRLMDDDVTFHAFHLPTLLKHLQKSRLSGELTMTSEVGDVSSISIYDGRIFSITTPDKDTFFGGVAVSFGFVAAEEVVEALNDPSKKLLGQKLIDSFLLSPHAISVILEEQLALRLSQLIQNHLITLQWSHRKFSIPDNGLNPARLDSLIDDWLTSKFTLDWIKNALTHWGEYRIMGNYHATIQDCENVHQLIAHGQFSEKADSIYLFSQLIHRKAFLGSQIENEKQNFFFLERRLDNLLKNFNSQNYFQILGVTEKSQNLEINKAFEDLKGYYSPEGLPQHCPDKVKQKCQAVYAQFLKAHQTLGDDVKRHQYQLLQQNRRAQEMLEAEPIYRAAILEIHSDHAKSAAKKFQSLLDRNLDFKDLKSYRIWAGLRIDRRYKDLTLEQVPPEQRHSAPYLMAKGVSYRNKGQLEKAFQAFRTAQVLDQTLNIAKYELKQLLSELNKNRSDNRSVIREVTSILETIYGAKRRGA